MSKQVNENDVFFANLSKYVETQISLLYKHHIIAPDALIALQEPGTIIESLSFAAQNIDSIVANIIITALNQGNLKQFYIKTDTLSLEEINEIKDAMSKNSSLEAFILVVENVDTKETTELLNSLPSYAKIAAAVAWIKPEENGYRKVQKCEIKYKGDTYSHSSESKISINEQLLSQDDDTELSRTNSENYTNTDLPEMSDDPSETPPAMPSENNVSDVEISGGDNAQNTNSSMSVCCIL